MSASDFAAYFAALTHADGDEPISPHPWQAALALDDVPGNRMIRIPTGLGKTLGVLGAWLWHRVERDDERWPRRLVWCLPMRVLVEQTHAEVVGALTRLGRMWSEETTHAGRVGVHLLMGGADAGGWHLHPEACSVLIGTQDMLLSRALNRGYSAGRARWPTDFGLLNRDALWVLDEVQLMDVGFASSGQLQAFRDRWPGAASPGRPCHSWWMSATLQPSWFTASPETRLWENTLPRAVVTPEQRHGALWEEVSKPVEMVTASGTKDLALIVAQEHLANGRGARGPTLAIVNRVEDAVAIDGLLRRNRDLRGTDLRLVHSRFRPADRATWRASFLSRGVSAPGTDRIIVATQVVEAGVDVSAGALVTQLAPWASLVQRFGRAARWGGTARVVVVDTQPRDDAAAAPYTSDAFEASRKALGALSDVSPLCLERFEERAAALLKELYPYVPKHLLLEHEVIELFDTSQDLSGADIDISRFIRTGEERDLQVFWLDIVAGEAPESDIRATRGALCSVPFLKARDWLCGKETASAKAPRLKRQIRAWVWDYADGRWRFADRSDLYPGQTVLVASSCGGYDSQRGWDPSSTTPVVQVPAAVVDAEQAADRSQEDETLSAGAWQTIATHGRLVAEEAVAIARQLAPEYVGLFDLAARWHDVGKAHPAFASSIKTGAVGRPNRRDLAKAPPGAWLGPGKLYPSDVGGRRRGFRHELVSTLALFGVLGRHDPSHPALLGPWLSLLDKAGFVAPAEAPAASAAPSSIEREVMALSAREFDTVAYLVCCHHGKVRQAWHVSPGDQASGDTTLRIQGVRQGDVLPTCPLFDAEGRLAEVPETTLTLDAAAVGLNSTTGRGWSERVGDLLALHGPFEAAFLEAIMRAADQRVSGRLLADPLLTAENDHYGLEERGSALAEPPPGGEGASLVGEHPPERRSEHGLRGRADGSPAVGAGTRAPDEATRYVETSNGVLSYRQLAPLLGLEVARIEHQIANGDFDTRPLHDSLVLDLHRRMCQSLVPQMTGWRLVDVVVGSHTPPAAYEVPLAMREYGRDLAARLESIDGLGEPLLEALAFAEGRLLSIHPFQDFNGRATRLLLRVIMHRLDLPGVDLLPIPSDVRSYLDALAAADRHDWSPLTGIWRVRLAGGEP